MSKLIGAKLGETAYLSVTDDGKLQYSLTGADGDFVEFETSGGGGDIDTSNLTATADDLLEGETAIGLDGAEITGTIQTVTLRQNGNTVSVAKGYVAEDASITVPGEGGGTDISDATATADMVLADAIFYGLNGRGTGTIQTVTATLSDNIVTVPKGYHQTQTLTVAVAETPTVSDNVVTLHKGYIAAETDVTIATATASKSGNVVTIPKGFHQAQTLTVGTAKEAETIVPGDADIIIPADTYLAGDLTIQAVGESGSTGETGASMAFYKCTEVDVGMAYDDYQNANVSGVTSPTEINGEFTIKDPMTLDNNRVFVNGNYTIGYDKENTAWCITEADSPNYINSIFYAKIDGLSTEEGTLANPFWWDSEGVATSDRTTTGSYNLNEAPMNEESWMYEGYCFYVKLKAGTAYTIGINVPANNDEEGVWYDPYLYLKDTAGNQLASGTRTDTGMSLTYTPTADGVFIIQAMEEYNSVSTPITCSPAPEQSTNPPVGLFEQTDWKVGAGVAPQSGVSGTPTVTPIAMPGRDEVGYAEWSGKLMEQNTETGAWSETETIRDGMKAYNWTPAPGGYYSEDGNVASNLYRGLKGSVYGWGYLKYGAPEDKINSYMPNKLYDISFKKIVIDNNNRYYGIGIDGYLYSWYSSDNYTPVKQNDTKFQDIACGRAHAVALDIDGYIWARGYNAYGQLCDGTTTATTSFAKVGTSVWSFIYCSKEASILINTSGEMWGAGEGSNYIFGNNSTSTISTLTKLNDKTWKSVWGADTRTFAIDTDGYLWGAGSSGNGSLGTGSTTTEQAFVQIGNQKWKKVATGEIHTIAINAEGFLYGWGYNNIGQLGNGEGTGTSYKPVQIDNTKKWIDVTAYYQASGGVDEYGQAFWWGGNSSYLTPFMAFNPQKIHVPGKCFSIVYARNDYTAFVLTDE